MVRGVEAKFDGRGPRAKRMGREGIVGKVQGWILSFIDGICVGMRHGEIVEAGGRRCAGFMGLRRARS